ncbi:hypothetical protein RRG08_016778 [Elysia crispata]|uniref:Uncharacterized protein n=1 Tax=Elysia crispata TaxID=231223 RepID=A0AAE0ZZ22_9GAST|nr:hypothetical protein RRG08_016778 [Elysia crispata]
MSWRISSHDQHFPEDISTCVGTMGTPRLVTLRMRVENAMSSRPSDSPVTDARDLYPEESATQQGQPSGCWDDLVSQCLLSISKHFRWRVCRPQTPPLTILVLSSASAEKKAKGTSDGPYS